MLVHIAAYMHNTVMVHNLITQLERKFPQVQIVQLPNEKEAGTVITLYTYGDDTAKLLEEKSLNNCDVALNQLSHENVLLQDQLQQSKQELFKHYFTDTLTKLPNIYQLREDLQDNDEDTLIILTIDNFKIINDFYGYVAGDFLLEQLANRLKKSIENAKTYRLSGSEFGITIRQSFDFYALKNFLTDLCEEFKHLSFEYAQTVVYMDLTFASIPTADRDEIFSKVSMALQYAKKMQQPFWIYEDRMHFQNEYESNLKTSVNIRKSILDSGIVPYFQPIICNKTNKVVKFECLSRLIDNAGNILSPKHFIPIAKTIKVYNEVTRTIINKSFDTFMGTNYLFSLNISIEDIMSQEIYSFIMEKLKNSGLGPQVTFELLESEHIQDYHKVSRFITEVKRYGAKIAIDDFGSGYSNFSYLTKIDVDFIKIDGSIIEDIDQNKASRMVVETIVDFAKKLGIETVAEYVHSAPILHIVKEMGIDYSQGFEIDKPQPTVGEGLDIDDSIKI